MKTTFLTERDIPNILSDPADLTEEQKAQARENIGVKEAVLFSEQDVTAEQKAQLLENVGLSSADTISNRELTELWAELVQLRGIVHDWPTLKSGMTGWYGDTSLARNALTEVNFVKDYTPTGSEDSTWAADADGSGSITGYRTGTVVTISANGSDKMRLPADSSLLFANLQLVTSLTGLELLDASNVTTLYSVFFNMSHIREIDISSWHLPKVTETRAMCYKCYNLRSFKFSRYGTASIENSKGMFSQCSKLTEVDMGRGLSLVGEIAFEKCLGLEKAVGLGSVTSIGDKAFVYTPQMKETDLRCKNITSIGSSAFRLSSAEDVVNLSAVSLDNVGDLATRNKRWSEEALEALKAIEMPDVYIDVPNPDNQSNYTDILFGTRDGEELYISTNGCFALSCYHAWNAKYAGTEQEYSNFEDWWNAKDFPTQFVPTNDWSQKTDREDLLAVLGWSLLEDCYIGTTEPLQKIVDSLAAGLPVFGTMHSVNLDGSKHAILIVGCDSNTRKLAVLDPNVIGTSGTVSWVSYEDIFTEDYDDYDYITLVDYGD